jgi:N-acetylmuramoyl-L-alanine amidase
MVPLVSIISYPLEENSALSIINELQVRIKEGVIMMSKKEFLILVSLFLLVVAVSPAWSEEENPSALEQATFQLAGKPYLSGNIYTLKDGKLCPVTSGYFASRAKGDPLDALRDLYVSIDAPGTQKLLAALGAISSWSSSGETLFIFSSGRNIYFDLGAGWVTFRGREQRLERGFIKKEEGTCIPLADLLVLMGITLERGETCGTFTLLPVIDDLLWKEDMGTRDFLIHSTCPLKCITESSDERSITLLFPGTRSSLTAGESSMKDARVKVEDTSAGEKVTVFYPDYWEGRFTERRLSGDITIEMLPRFPLTPGYRYEQVKKMEVQAAKNGRRLVIEATGPLQYLWSYLPKERLLIVDVPLLEMAGDIRKPSLEGGPARSIEPFFLSKSYGDTRLYITMNENASFSFIEDKKSPYVLQIDLTATGQIAKTQGRGVTGDAENWGTIVLDPGHGGCDPGAVNRTLGLTEKEVNLDVCRRLARDLERSGWKVILTRVTDRDVSWANSPDRVELQARVDVAQANSASIFISVHCNASTSSEMRGSSLHWCKDEDAPLAQAMVTATQFFESGLGIPQRGLVQNNFYVLNHSTMPALLIEMAHISNYQEALIFADGACRQKFAEAIARGVEKYFLERGFKKKG